MTSDDYEALSLVRAKTSPGSAVQRATEIERSPGMNAHLEDVNIAVLVRIARLKTLHEAITIEQRHVSDLMILRATATRLIANGHGKAFGIVREIDARLAKMQVRTNTVASILVELDNKLAVLHSKE
jgi:hypothetical protein